MLSTIGKENERIATLENIVSSLLSRVEQLEKNTNGKPKEVQPDEIQKLEDRFSEIEKNAQKLRDDYEDYLDKQAEEDLKGRITALENTFYEQGDLPERDDYGERIQKLENHVLPIIKLHEYAKKYNINKYFKIIKDGSAVFRRACQNNNLEIVKLLIEYGADINTGYYYNQTPLIIACQNNNLEIVKYLIKHGADINAKNNNGATPLHYACYNNNLEIAKILVENGADINLRDKYQHNPLRYAIDKGYNEITNYLKSHGAHE